jgi:hypothetical protein
MSQMSDIPTPWVFVHNIPASGAYTMSLIDWMVDGEAVFIEPNLQSKPTLFAHFTKAPYSHDLPVAARADVRFSPSNVPGGRGTNSGNITRTRIGEWIRYELNVAQAGSFRATLGAANPTAYEQIVVLRDIHQNILTQFVIPANNPLPASGWDDALLVEGTEEFFLPAGRFILEMFFVNCGTGATNSADLDWNNYLDGPDVDIIILERTGDMEPPVRQRDPNVWPLPFPITRIGGDATHRQRGWSTDGYICPFTYMVGYGLPVAVYNRIIGLVLETAGRPGGPGTDHTVQLHIVNDGGGEWLPEWAPRTELIWDPNRGPFGAMVFDIENMPAPFNVHVPSFARTTSAGFISVAYYNQNWEELNFMRAYLILSDCPDCGANLCAVCASFTPPMPLGATGEGAAPAPVAAVTGAAPAAPVAPPVQVGETITYVVRYGENLWGIAYNFYGSMSSAAIGRIIRANRDYLRATNNAVSEGTVLILPVQGMRSPASRAHLGRADLYLVREGDTLASIAEALLGDASRWPEIFEANRPWVRNANNIVSGQWLVIPA